jgi:hypothetical protein
LGDDLAAGVAGFGADVEDPVGFGGYCRVVLDDDDGVPFIDEAVEDVSTPSFTTNLSHWWRRSAISKTCVGDLEAELTQRIRIIPVQAH